MVIPDTAHGTNPASVAMAGYTLVRVKTDAARQRRHRRPARQGGRAHRRADADEPLDARAVRGADRRDRRDLPLGRRAALLRRRQPERRLRHLPPGRHGLRHRALQPAQDLLAAARRRRSRRRAGGGAARRSSRSCPYRWSCATATASGSSTTGRKSIGKVRGFGGPFGVFVRAYAFMRMWGPGLRDMSEVAVRERQLRAGAAAGCLRAADRPATACTSSWSRRAGSSASTA